MDKKKKIEELKKNIFDQNRSETNALPIGLEACQQLFLYVDKKLITEGCDDTLKFTLEFLGENNLPVEESLVWMRKQGGYCDCEVLMNIAYKFHNSK